MFFTPRTRNLPFSLIARSLNPQSRPISSKSHTKGEIARLKRPSRGGRNLSERYRNLERALRGEQALTKGREDLVHQVSTVPLPASNQKKEAAKAFHGFVVPEEPKPPADDECCMSGCAVCVYDLYEESLEVYEESIAALRRSLGASSIPEDTWPFNVRPNADKPGPESRKEVILNAFEEMERKLREKKDETGGDVPQKMPSTTSLQPPASEATDRPMVQREVKRSLGVDVKELYEGSRWILFSNR